MPIRDRVARLVGELPKEPHFPTQGATLFLDLERREVERGYTPPAVVKTLLSGRGANMFYLHRLLDESLGPLDPDIPVIFGSGVLTGIVPSAARGNVTSWSPESGVLMDCNCGDYFPSFLKIVTGVDHLVIYGSAAKWTLMRLRQDGQNGKPVTRIDFIDASQYSGLDNLDMRARVAEDFGGQWARDLAMANITRAGENLVLTSGIMG